MIVALLLTAAGLLVVALYAALDAATAESARHAADSSRHLKARLAAEAEAERLRELTPCLTCEQFISRAASAEAEANRHRIRADSLLQQLNHVVVSTYEDWHGSKVDPATQDEAA